MTASPLPASATSSFAPLQDVPGQTLRWVQPDAWKQRYELRAGENLLAIMQNESFWKSSVIVESAKGKWRLDRPGFGSKVKVTDATSQAELLVLLTKFLGDGMVLLDGNQLRWHSTNFWSSDWAFTNESGVDVISFKTTGSWKSSAVVTVAPGAEGLPVFLLLALGWYLHTLHSSDVAVGVAIFASLVATQGALR